MNQGLICCRELVVAMDYGQFVLRGGATAVEEANDEELVDVAMRGDGIAAAGGSVLVLCRQQNNFAMPLRVEVWRREPADDLDLWGDAFEAVLDVDAGGQLWYESPTLPPVRCEVPAGFYHVRIAGREGTASGWPGSTTPEAVWRVQLWPATTVVHARRVRS